MKAKSTSNAVEILKDEFDHAPGFAAEVACERQRADAAQAIYDARTQAGLTQEQLAGLVGTCQSAISRLEDADYEGHSLQMLERIARALDLELHVRMVPRRRAEQPVGIED